MLKRQIEHFLLSMWDFNCYALFLKFPCKATLILSPTNMTFANVPCTLNKADFYISVYVRHGLIIVRTVFPRIPA